MEDLVTVLRVREMDIQISEDTDVAGLSTGNIVGLSTSTIVGLMGKDEATNALSTHQIDSKHK